GYGMRIAARGHVASPNQDADAATVVVIWKSGAGTSTRAVDAKAPVRRIGVMRWKAGTPAFFEPKRAELDSSSFGPWLLARGAAAPFLRFSASPRAAAGTNGNNEHPTHDVRRERPVSRAPRRAGPRLARPRALLARRRARCRRRRAGHVARVPAPSRPA